MNKLFLFLGLMIIAACNQAQQVTDKGTTSSTSEIGIIVEDEYDENGQLKKVEKSDEEWKTELSEQEFHVLRQKGTERAFTGDLLENKEAGTYICRGCALPLFSSTTKYKSGTGWPSYFQPIKPVFIKEEADDKYGWDRVEVLCGRCEGHLGHVFKDGPKPTGLRYCINSVSLDFVPAKSGKE